MMGNAGSNGKDGPIGQDQKGSVGHDGAAPKTSGGGGASFNTTAYHYAGSSGGSGGGGIVIFKNVFIRRCNKTQFLLEIEPGQAPKQLPVGCEWPLCDCAWMAERG